MFLSKPGRGPPPPRRDDCGAHGAWRRSLRKRLPPALRPGPLRGEKRFTRSSPVLRRKDRS